MDTFSACERAREQLSACLDGELADAESRAAAVHVARCDACTTWWIRVQRLETLTRHASAAPAPALSPQAMARVLAAAPKPARGVGILRVALLLVGLAQLLLGIAQIADQAGLSDSHMHASAVTTGHLWHESAAWNVAVGAALAWLAWRRVKPAALIPVMTVFVAMLALLTLNDAIGGQVDTSRIVSHGLLLTGYLLLLAQQRQQPNGQRPPASTTGDGSEPGARRDDSDDGTAGPLATVYPFPVQARAANHAVLRTRRKAA